MVHANSAPVTASGALIATWAVFAAVLQQCCFVS